MAKLKLSTSLCGPDFAAKPGDVIEVSDKEAAAHVANGNGTLVVEEKKKPVTADDKK